MGSLKPGELVEATRYLALLTRLGLPLPEGLKALEPGSPFHHLGEQLAAGDTLSEAVARHPRLFPSFYRSALSAAGKMDRPEELLASLSAWLERSEGLGRRIRAALMYPLLVLNVLVAELLLLGWVVLPEAVVPLAAAAGLGIPAWTVPALTGSGWVLLLGVLLVDLAAFGPGWLASWLPWMGLRRHAEEALWGRAVGSLVALGIPLPAALEAALDTVRIPRLRAALAAAAEKVSRGGTLSQALAGMDPLLVWSVEAGERQESLAELLIEGAEELEAEIDERARSYVRMAEPWAIAALALPVLAALAAYWWPFYAAVMEIV